MRHRTSTACFGAAAFIATLQLATHPSFCTAQNGVASSTGDGALHFKTVAPVDEALGALESLVQKIRITITDKDEPGALPRIAAGQLQTAMGRARQSVAGTCALMLGLLQDGSVIELISHQAIFSCAVVFESTEGVDQASAAAVRRAGIETLEAMEADPAFATYWSDDPRAVETHAVWAGNTTFAWQLSARWHVQ